VICLAISWTLVLKNPTSWMRDCVICMVILQALVLRNPASVIAWCARWYFKPWCWRTQHPW
jgi:hypothetical protein